MCGDRVEPGVVWRMGEWVGGTPADGVGLCGLSPCAALLDAAAEDAAAAGAADAALLAKLASSSLGCRFLRAFLAGLADVSFSGVARARPEPGALRRAACGEAAPAAFLRFTPLFPATRAVAVFLGEACGWGAGAEEKGKAAPFCCRVEAPLVWFACALDCRSAMIPAVSVTGGAL